MTYLTGHNTSIHNAQSAGSLDAQILGLLGFSQGAKLAASLLFRQQVQD